MRYKLCPLSTVLLLGAKFAIESLGLLCWVSIGQQWLVLGGTESANWRFQFEIDGKGPVHYRGVPETLTDFER